MRWLVMMLAGLLLLAGCGEESRPGAAGTTRNFGSESGTSAPGAIGTAASASTAAPQPTLPARPTLAASLDVKSWAAPPPMTIDPSKTYMATIQVEYGTIVIRLLPDQAPQTVNNFVFLAREKFYDGTTFHRVLENFMAQGGDPTGAGIGGPGYTIPDELDQPMIFDRPGLLAMAKTPQPDSAGSQFFITFAPATHLNNGYTIFGEVVEGMEVVKQIRLRDPSANPYAPPGDVIKSITIEEG